jgi:hypothetical protein
MVVDVKGNVGIGTNPSAAWNTGYKVLQVGGAGVLQSHTGGASYFVRLNTYYDGVADRAITTGGASCIDLLGNAMSFRLAPSVLPGAAQTFVTPLALSAGAATITGNTTVTGNLVVTGNITASTGNVANGGFLIGDDGDLVDPNTGFVLFRVSYGIQVSSGKGLNTVVHELHSNGTSTHTNNIIVSSGEGTGVAVRLGAAYGRPGVYSAGTADFQAESTTVLRSLAGTMHLIAGGAYVHPVPDNQLYLGHPSYRFPTIYLVSAPVVGSALEFKENIVPLDSVACVEAVLNTDWVAFDYRKPVMAELVINGNDKERKERQDKHKENYEKMLEDTAPSRRQKGYVLDSPGHRVHDLFGLSDRRNRSDGADLAVVACALQHALQEIAELKAQLHV